jgi:hypothetical protein
MGKCFLALICLLLTAASAFAQTFTDPVPYCRAVGTIDKPDARYAGPKLPAWMAAKLGLEGSQGQMMEWRCAGGEVLACLYGANIPCYGKADTSRAPTSAIAEFCRQNPGSDFVPMVVTGHDTVVSWACQGSDPVVTSVGEVDSQGYARAYWQAVSP